MRLPLFLLTMFGLVVPMHAGSAEYVKSGSAGQTSYVTELHRIMVSPERHIWVKNSPAPQTLTVLAPKTYQVIGKPAPAKSAQDATSAPLYCLKTVPAVYKMVKVRVARGKDLPPQRLETAASPSSSDANLRPREPQPETSASDQKNQGTGHFAPSLDPRLVTSSPSTASSSGLSPASQTSPLSKASQLVAGHDTVSQVSPALVVAAAKPADSSVQPARLPSASQAQLAVPVKLAAEHETSNAPGMGVTAPTNSYQLESGDKIHVTVYGEPDLSGDFSLDGEGIIAYPLLGNIQAGGKTSSELQTRIAAGLMPDYIKDARVNVEILKFRPFFILGEVNKPGSYPFATGLTVERAVAMASGYTYRANLSKVYIRHANAAKEELTAAPAKDLVLPGDTLRIPERYF